MEPQAKTLEKYGGRVDLAIAAMMNLLNEGQREWRRIMTEMSKIGTNLEGLKDNHEKLTCRVFQIEDWSRKPFPISAVKIFISVIQKYFNGMCPCCGENQILNGAGIKMENFEIDHFKGPKWNKITEGWPICADCHGKLTCGYLSRDGNWVEQAFKGFQMRVQQFTSAMEDDSQTQMFK